MPPKKAEEGKSDKDASKDAAEAGKGPEQKLAEAVRDAKASNPFAILCCVLSYGDP